MACPTFPSGKLREMIERTVETGNEHGFVKCGDGEISEIVEGGRTRMDIGEAIESCDLDDGPVQVVHTHPNGVKKLSHVDRKAAASEHVENVCVAVEGGEVKCESVDSCEFEVET